MQKQYVISFLGRLNLRPQLLYNRIFVLQHLLHIFNCLRLVYLQLKLLLQLRQLFPQLLFLSIPFASPSTTLCLKLLLGLLKLRLQPPVLLHNRFILHNNLLYLHLCPQLGKLSLYSGLLNQGKVLLHDKLLEVLHVL